MTKMTYINLSDLTLPEFEAHKIVSDSDIQEISDSIKSIGVLEPLIVRKINKHFEIVAGCIRYRAARLAGLKSVPCIIYSLEDQAAEVIKIHENLKRISLDHVDQGHTFLMMRDTFSMTEESISKTVGKSISYISNHITLVTFDSQLTSAVKNKTLSFSQARELFSVKDKSTRRQLQRYCQNNGATIEVLKSWIKEYRQNQSLNPPSDSSTPSQTYHYDPPKNYRYCQACGKAVLISDIRQVLYCPPCDTALKQAINEESSKQNK